MIITLYEKDNLNEESEESEEYEEYEDGEEDEEYEESDPKKIKYAINLFKKVDKLVYALPLKQNKTYLYNFIITIIRNVKNTPFNSLYE